MSDSSQTVRVHFAGYVDLCVDATANPAVLTSEVARDVEYELAERWRPEEDPSSRLAGHIDEHPLVSVRPVFGLTETLDERLSALLATVKAWEAVDGAWVDFRDQHRDEHGDETDSDALDKAIVTKYFQQFWDASEELKCAAASLLSALPQITQSTS